MLKSCEHSGRRLLLDSVLCHIAQEILSQRINNNCKEMLKPVFGEEAEVEYEVPTVPVSDDEGYGDAWDEETRGKWWPPMGWNAAATAMDGENGGLVWARMKRNRNSDRWWKMEPAIAYCMIWC